MTRTALGWNDHFDQHFAPYATMGYVPGRVCSEHTHVYRVMTDSDECLAHVSGKFRHRAAVRSVFPAIGDWVALEPHGPTDSATIHAVLPRISFFSRKAPAGNALTEEQLIAANVTTVFIMTGLDENYNVRRIERYLTMAWESGARPVIVLSKLDLCDDLEDKLQEVYSVALGVPVLPISALTEHGLESLHPFLTEGQTIALLGSSGVGKSTLTNALMGRDMQRVGTVREVDHRGRHTTTNRELTLLPHGAVLIDTPGLRELQLWDAEEGLSQTFQDIEDLAQTCRFRDCRHRSEPGCAVQATIREGTLDPQRFESYEKLQRELTRLEQKKAELAKRLSRGGKRR